MWNPSELILPFPKVNFEWKIEPKDSITLLGSCFSDHIGQKLIDHRFDTWSNEIGILFNPVSVFKTVLDAFHQIPTDDTLFTTLYDFWFHHQWHSKVVGESKEELVVKIKKHQEALQKRLLKTNYLIITLGTSIVRTLDQKICANCHKQPNGQFDKRFLKSDEVHAYFFEFYQTLKRVNPKIKLIFTVSPIRHTKEGLIENNRSKAQLINWVQDWVSTFDDIFYFPSYEIMMDCLRDYRFYKKDKIHPTEEAVEIIWEYFKEKSFGTKSKDLSKISHKYLQMKAHKTRNSQTEEHQKFLSKMEQLEQQIKNLRK
ncbi:MAG: GSCFA domain-containing protein [Flavobacteriales bacterium]|jgi:hypothetical protein|nr:GSCFA domain-containing protein [Flavobacteriales bacterium]